MNKISKGFSILLAFSLILPVLVIVPNSAKADIGNFCSVYPELASSYGSVTVQNLTQNTSVTVSGFNGQGGSDSIDATIGDTIHIQMSGSASLGDAEGTVTGTVNVGSSTLFNQTVVGGVNGPADGNFTYDISSISNTGVVSVNAQACSTTTDVYVFINTSSFSCSALPATVTIDPGSSISYAINTTAGSGFSSPVNYSASIALNSGTAANPPTVGSYTNNNQTPPSTTTVNISTTGTTTPGTYTVTFTGTGGGSSNSCVAQLIVNSPHQDFALTLSLIVSPPNSSTPPNGAYIGTSPQFTVVAVCTGGFNGTITSLTPYVDFPGATATLASTSLNCGSSTTLTVNGTSSISTSQISSPQNILSRDITVTGSAVLN